MKILHVNKFFDLRDGVDIYTHRLMAEQERVGHEVHVFATHSAKNVPSLDAASFVQRFDFTRFEGVQADAKKAAAFLWNQEARSSMEQMIREIQPDVIHLHNIYHHLSTSILAPIRRSRIRCVQTLHDYKLACPNYRMFTEGAPCERCKGGKYYNAIAHRCLFPSTAGNMLAAFEMGMTKMTQAYEKTVSTFIAPSQFLADKMVAWGEPASKFRVIPNPVEIPDTVGTRSGGYFLAAGRLAQEKGFEFLIRAAAAAPSVKIKIAGIGPDEARLQQLAQSLDAVNVEFVGFQRSADLSVLRRDAIGFVMPSVWYENAPLAVLEALADGIPVIASRIGGLPEMIEDGVNGFLVEPQDSAGLARAMTRLVQSDGCDPEAMAAASRARAMERYQWDQHLKALEDVYV